MRASNIVAYRYTFTSQPPMILFFILSFILLFRLFYPFWDNGIMLLVEPTLANALTVLKQKLEEDKSKDQRKEFIEEQEDEIFTDIYDSDDLSEGIGAYQRLEVC